MKKVICFLIFVILIYRSEALDVEMIEKADIFQVFGLQIQSKTIIPMNDLNIENGYVLYHAEIETKIDDVTLEVENVRDFAAVYVDDELQGSLTIANNNLSFSVKPGKHILKLYVENIGRYTYGPEILDNFKGLFGNINLNGVEIKGWTITELKVRNCDVTKFFYSTDSLNVPGFYKGYFTLDTKEDIYLDTTGWGMGEAWINGEYLGAFWKADKQKSIQIPLTILKKEYNEVVIFDIEKNEQKNVKLSSYPVFN